jgi:class 3 adenylate cyclase
MFAGEGFVELGEIRLRMGDFVTAREAFQMAEGLGATPQPGLAMLDLAEGNIAAAAAGVRGALEENAWDRLHRARLLPARVTIALAVGDMATARDSAADLESIASDYHSSAITASSGLVRGFVLLADGDAEAAITTLRKALRLWQEVDAPYEAAECRVVLARAYMATGQQESATLELRAARTAFERLGAAPDAERTAALLAVDAGGGGVPLPPRDTRTFMFTDIFQSTDLVELLGDESWEHLLTWHDQTLRAAFAAHGGEEIKHGGDGFFVAFPSPSMAMDCAVEIQRSLSQHRKAHGFAPQVRIGLHEAEATMRGKDFGGKGVHVAARIAAAAEAGEILITSESCDGLAADYSVSAIREIKLKGIAEPVSVASVDWR